MGQRDRGLERAWRRRVRERQTSGLSVRAFCAREGLAESAFYFWRRELDRRQAERRPLRSAERREERTAEPDFPCSPSPAGSRFVPVRLADPAEAARNDAPPSSADVLELVHPGGIVIRVPAGCELAVLGPMLDLLDDRERGRHRC
jgi:transposase-like protein